MSTEVTTIVARCHCGKNEFNIDIPNADIPLPASVCHCTSCRLSLGTFCGTAIRLRKTLFTLCVPETLSVYRPRDDNQTASRFFCSSCFTHMFWYRAADAAVPEPSDISKDSAWTGWTVYTSCLAEKSADGSKRLEDLVRVDTHQFIGDTGDGGMASWIYDGGQSKMYMGLKRASKELSFEDLADMEKKLQPNVELETADHLDGGCHCGTVRVRIKRDHGYAQYLGTSCGCSSCHVNAGNEASQQWTWVDFPNISFATGNDYSSWTQYPEDWSKGDVPKGIHVRVSSDGVNRGACPKCGADIFWRYYKSKDKRVSLSAALFTHDADRLGAKHKGWFRWSGTEPEDVVDGRGRVLIEPFLKGYPRWAKMFAPVNVISLGKAPQVTDDYFNLLAKARPGKYRPFPTHSLEEFGKTVKENKEDITMVLLGVRQTDESEAKARQIVEDTWGKDNNIQFFRIPSSLLAENLNTSLEGMTKWFLERTEKE